MIVRQPVTLGIRQLEPVYEPRIEGDKRQRVELQPAFATRMGRHVIVRHNHVEVLEANTTPAFLVIARLIGHHHAWLQRLIAAARTYTLRTLVHVEKSPNAVPSAVAVVETSVPHAGAGQPIQYHATGTFREFLPGQ